MKPYLLPTELGPLTAAADGKLRVRSPERLPVDAVVRQLVVSGHGCVRAGTAHSASRPQPRSGP